MQMKQEYNREDEFDHEVGFDGDSSGSGERKYDTRDEEGGYLRGSGDLDGSLGMKINSCASSHETSNEGNNLEPSQVRLMECKQLL